MSKKTLLFLCLFFIFPAHKLYSFENETIRLMAFIKQYFAKEYAAEGDGPYSDMLFLKTTHAYNEYKRVMQEIKEGKKPSFPTSTALHYYEKQKRNYLRRYPQNKDYLKNNLSTFKIEWRSAFIMLKKLEAELTVEKLAEDPQPVIFEKLKQQLEPESKTQKILADTTKKKTRRTPYKDLKWI